MTTLFDDETIIRLAREAGWGFNNSRDSDFCKAQLRFARLVAAYLRTESAAYLEGYEIGYGESKQHTREKLKSVEESLLWAHNEINELIYSEWGYDPVDHEPIVKALEIIRSL